MDKAAKQREKEYRSYVEKKVEEFNANGKVTVAVFCDAFFPSVDGVVMVIDNVARRIADRCNVVVFVPGHNGETVKRDYVVVGVRSRYFKGINYDAVSFFNLGSFYRRIIKKLKVDVIHAHSPFMMGLAALKLHKKTGAPFVMTFHSQYKKDIYKETKSRLLTAIGLKLVMHSFNSSTEVWTMHEMSAATVREYGYKGKIEFMPNATDYVYPADADKRAENLREKYGVKESEKLFSFVGRLVSQKNIFFIAEVLGNLKRRGLPFKMMFIGDGPDRKELEKRIAAAGVSNECIMIGRVSDKDILEDYYIATDLLLFPSKYDVSSIIQIEAAAMKTPCAFVEDSVTSCTVTADVDGLILPEDVEKFASGVYDLVTDENRLLKMGEKAHENIYVTWEDVVDKTCRRYIELAGSGKVKK